MPGRCAPQGLPGLSDCAPVALSSAPFGRVVTQESHTGNAREAAWNELEAYVIRVDTTPCNLQTGIQLSLQETFELGLLRAGLRVSSDEYDHVLVCNFRLLRRPPTGLVVFSLEVSLIEAVLDFDTSDGYIAQTWSVGSIGSVGEENLADTAKEYRTQCAEWFEADWRRANQGGRKTLVDIPVHAPDSNGVIRCPSR